MIPLDVFPGARAQLRVMWIFSVCYLPTVGPMFYEWPLIYLCANRAEDPGSNSCFMVVKTEVQGGCLPLSFLSMCFPPSCCTLSLTGARSAFTQGDEWVMVEVSRWQNGDNYGMKNTTSSASERSLQMAVSDQTQSRPPQSLQGPFKQGKACFLDL